MLTSNEFDGFDDERPPAALPASTACAVPEEDWSVEHGDHMARGDRSLGAAGGTRAISDGKLAEALLSPRELVTLQLLARGYSSEQIAGIYEESTSKAVEVLVERARVKLGAQAPAQGVVIARRMGLIIG